MVITNYEAFVYLRDRYIEVIDNFKHYGVDEQDDNLTAVMFLDKYCDAFQCTKSCILCRRVGYKDDTPECHKCMWYYGDANDLSDSDRKRNKFYCLGENYDAIEDSTTWDDTFELLQNRVNTMTKIINHYKKHNNDKI